MLLALQHNHPRAPSGAAASRTANPAPLLRPKSRGLNPPPQTLTPAGPAQAAVEERFGFRRNFFERAEAENQLAKVRLRLACAQGRVWREAPPVPVSLTACA